MGRPIREEPGCGVALPRCRRRRPGSPGKQSLWPIHTEVDKCTVSSRGLHSPNPALITPPVCADSPASKPGHGKPGPAWKSRAWAAFFGPMGGPRQQNHDPTADSGQTWIVFSGVFGKVRPESPTIWQKTPHLGRAWREFLGPIVRPGRASATISRVRLFLGPARPGPAQEDAQVYPHPWTWCTYM
jgi:hypothetical protein